MPNYIPFTPEQRELARRTDLCALLERRGETIRRSGAEYEWRDGAQKVTIRGHLWFHQYEQVGGDAIDFVRRYYHMSYPEAVAFLLNNDAEAFDTAPPVVRKSFVLPPPNENNRRVYAYLSVRRGIDYSVLNAFIRAGLIYESADYHNALFVGKDPNGVAVHAHKRGTGSTSRFKGNETGSDPRYSFHWSGTDDALFLFEAPIDMLSFISLHKDDWRSHSYAACCGVSDRVLLQSLEDNPNIATVYLCLDNDKTGQAANRRMAEKLSRQNINAKILVPTRKDWNEDLLYRIQESEVKIPCPASQV